MYNVIYNFAKNHNLVPIENFTLKFISAYILLDKNGNFIGFEVKDKKDKARKYFKIKDFYIIDVFDITEELKEEKTEEA